MLLLNSSENMVCRCCCRTSQNHIDFVQPLETVKIHVLCNKNTSGMFQPAMKAFFFVADEECVVYWGSVYYYRVRTEG